MSVSHIGRSGALVARLISVSMEIDDDDRDVINVQVEVSNEASIPMGQLEPLVETSEGTSFTPTDTITSIGPGLSRTYEFNFSIMGGDWNFRLWHNSAGGRRSVDIGPHHSEFTLQKADPTRTPKSSMGEGLFDGAFDLGMDIFGSTSERELIDSGHIELVEYEAEADEGGSTRINVLDVELTAPLSAPIAPIESLAPLSAPIAPVEPLAPLSPPIAPIESLAPLSAPIAPIESLAPLSAPTGPPEPPIAQPPIAQAPIAPPQAPPTGPPGPAPAPSLEMPTGPPQAPPTGPPNNDPMAIIMAQSNSHAPPVGPPQTAPTNSPAEPPSAPPSGPPNAPPNGPPSAPPSGPPNAPPNGPPSAPPSGPPSDPPQN